MMIRAKFRCLSTLHDWQGTTTVKLGPVKRDGNKDSENSFFWKYTPGGELHLTYPKGQTHMFKPGDYYYVDMEQHDDGTWRISASEYTDSSVNITLSVSEGGVFGHMRLWLSAEAEGAVAALRPHNSRWAVAFTFAEESDAAP